MRTDSGFSYMSHKQAMAFTSPFRNILCISKQKRNPGPKAPKQTLRDLTKKRDSIGVAKPSRPVPMPETSNTDECCSSVAVRVHDSTQDTKLIDLVASLQSRVRQRCGPKTSKV